MRAVFIFLIALLLGACAVGPTGQVTVPDATAEVVVAPPSTTSTVVQPKTNGKHVVWGDSLLWQALDYASCTECYVDGRELHPRPGMGMRELGLEIIQELDQQPDVMTLALGTNDGGTWGGRDQWNIYDEQAWTEVLSHAGNTKIVVVLPWIEDGNDTTPLDMASIERAREWLSQLPNVTIVDWYEYITPGVLDAGGIHVSAGNEGLRYLATVAGDPL